jgi:hypothetical protein
VLLSEPRRTPKLLLLLLWEDGAGVAVAEMNSGLPYSKATALLSEPCLTPVEGWGWRGGCGDSNSGPALQQSQRATL